MAISRPDGLGDIANLGMTLTEAKQLLAQVQQQVVAAQVEPTVAKAIRVVKNAGMAFLWYGLIRSFASVVRNP